MTSVLKGLQLYDSLFSTNQESGVTPDFLDQLFLVTKSDIDPPTAYQLKQECKHYSFIVGQHDLSTPVVDLSLTLNFEQLNEYFFLT